MTKNLTTKQLIQAVGVEASKIRWEEIRELKEIVDEAYDKKERELYETD